MTGVQGGPHDGASTVGDIGRPLLELLVIPDRRGLNVAVASSNPTQLAADPELLRVLLEYAIAGALSQIPPEARAAVLAKAAALNADPSVEQWSVKAAT